jgi:restriction endonuclease S subunit
MKLSDMAEIFIGVPTARYKYKDTIQSEKIPYKLFSQNMLSDSGIFQDYEAEVFYANKDISHSCTKTGDIVFGLRKPNEAVYIDNNSQNLLVQSYMAIIRCNKANVLPEYLAFVLNTKRIHNQLYRNIQGGSIQLIMLRHIKDLMVDIPSIENQQQIVEISKIGYSEIDCLQDIIYEKQKLLKSLI